MWDCVLAVENYEDFTTSVSNIINLFLPINSQFLHLLDTNRASSQGGKVEEKLNTRVNRLYYRYHLTIASVESPKHYYIHSGIHFHFSAGWSIIKCPF